MFLLLPDQIALIKTEKRLNSFFLINLITTHFLFSRYWSTMRSSVSWFTMLKRKLEKNKEKEQNSLSKERSDAERNHQV